MYFNEGVVHFPLLRMNEQAPRFIFYDRLFPEPAAQNSFDYEKVFFSIVCHVALHADIRAVSFELRGDSHNRSS